MSKAIIIEIKCRVNDSKEVETLLRNESAHFVGEDHQVDTYFQVKEGRLKLREGSIENTLIKYHRPESMELKRSEVLFQKLSTDNQALKEILSQECGVKVVVDKKRKIFFIENVKFHLDQVEGLGNFVEIEAIDEKGEKTETELSAQCQHYVQFLGLDPENFIAQSYSDMLNPSQ